MSSASIDFKVSRSLPRGWPIGRLQTAALFGGAALLLFAVTHGVIPALSRQTAARPILLWFGAAGFGVFLPLLLLGIALLRQEDAQLNRRTWSERLRFRPLTKADWVWTGGGLVAVAGSTATSVFLLQMLFGEADLQPSFLHFEPLKTGQWWILAVWLPFFAINIMGEEILWRGVILPRQEAAFSNRAWLANGLGWLGFHLAFGPTMLFILWPTTLIIPYIVQRRANSWIGVLIHGALNGGGFLAIACGLV